MNAFSFRYLIYIFGIDLLPSTRLRSDEQCSGITLSVVFEADVVAVAYMASFSILEESAYHRSAAVKILNASIGYISTAVPRSFDRNV